MQLLAEVTLTIDAKKSKDGFAGAWMSAIAGGKKTSGTLIGRVTDEKSIRAAESFAKGVDWPSYHGPHLTNRAADASTPLIDDLSKAHPVWRAEMPTRSGWGSGVDGRYSWRAAYGTVCGGSGTPVVADGRVYLFHYVPSGEPDAKLLEKVLADFEKHAKRKPTAVEREALVDFCRVYSDTIITCIDAQTGAVLWSVRFPFLSGNFQTHKWRGINPTASVIDSVLIANDYANNWVALDAVTGTVLWTRKRSQKVQQNQSALGAVRAGSLAILPGVGGDPSFAVDPKTGKVAWQQPGGPQALVWGKPGAERVVFLGGKTPICYEAATGKILWTMEEKLVGSSGSAALIQGDILVGHVLPDPKKRGGHFQGWKLFDTGTKKIWQDDYLPYDENLTVSLGHDRAYLVGENEIRSLDVQTGKLLGKQIFDGKTHPIGSNQCLAVVGDRLLLSPEGQHGTQSLQWVDSDNEHKLIGSKWLPPNNSTTAYGVHPLAFPIVDGRIFVRGMDGIYCYDLRKRK
jgi:outer membrane protein assembly factor BamB